MEIILERIWQTLGVGLFLIAVAVIAATAILPTRARAQHPPEHQELHEKFYSTWMRPQSDLVGIGHRTHSCCDRRDCYPAKFKNVSGTWFFWGRESQSWRAVPDGILEHNQPDPHESPDGQGHVCASPAHVFCAVLGAQT